MLLLNEISRNVYLHGEGSR